MSGAGVTTINADLRVGAVEETITVSGATPVVDTQTSAKREVVLSNEVLAAVPATRTYGNILAMVPGVQSLTLDVNSTQSLTGTATNFFFTSRGGRGNEGTVQVDGMNVGSAFGGGGVSSFAYDFVNATEVQVTVAGGLGESDRFLAVDYRHQLVELGERLLGRLKPLRGSAADISVGEHPVLGDAIAVE